MRRALLAVAVVGVVVGIAAWYTLHGHESTDDAQIDGTITPIAARVRGTVIEVEFDENQRVEAGQVLVRLDPADYQVALDKAQADLAVAEAGLAAERAGLPMTRETTASEVAGAEVGVVAVTMTWMFIFDPPYIRRALKHIDVLGIGLMTVGIGALQVGLDRGQESDWFSSRFITTLLITSAVALSLLIARELTVRDPVIDLRIFSERTYSTGVLLITLVGVVLYANLVLLPIMLQNLMGYSPYAAGVAMAPRGIGSFLAMPIVGMLVGRMDARRLLVGGFLLGALSQFWLASLNLNAGYWDLFWHQFVLGISLGLLFVPLTTITMDRISKPDMGNATSQFNLMRNIGGSVGIALIQSFVVRQRQLHTNRLGEHVSAYSPGARMMFERLEGAFRAAGADPVTAPHKATAALWGMVQREAATLAFLDAFHVLGILFLAIVPLVFLMRRPAAAPDGPVIAGE
jgi:DHA2 family multidrug resistance protein